jgi:hypothetical protein
MGLARDRTVGRLREYAPRDREGNQRDAVNDELENHEINAQGREVVRDDVIGVKFADIMTAEDAVLSNDWGKELETSIDRNVLDFDTPYQLNILSRLSREANRYAKTLAEVVGYEPMIGNISGIKYLKTPTPYSVCGLGDFDRLIKLNDIFRSLGSIQPIKLDKSEKLNFERKGDNEQLSHNAGSQFAPK